MFEEIMHKQVYLNISMRGMVRVLEICSEHAQGFLVQFYESILFNKAIYY